MVSIHESFLDLSIGTRKERVIFLEKVWTVATAGLHDSVLLDTKKNVASERPTALLPTVIRWEEEWKGRHGVKWDATDGPNGGAERIS